MALSSSLFWYFKLDGGSSGSSEGREDATDWRSASAENLGLARELLG